MITKTENKMRSIASLLNGEVSTAQEVLTAEKFLSKYQTPDTLLFYVEELKKTPYGIAYAEIFFNNLKEQMKITSPLITKVDKFSNSYFWAVFNNGGGVKVTLDDGGIEQFVTDYQRGVIKPNFDLYDLVELAQSLQSK